MKNSTTHDKNISFKKRAYFFLLVILVLVPYFILHFHNKNNLKQHTKQETIKLPMKKWLQNVSTSLGNKLASEITSIHEIENGYIIVGKYGKVNQGFPNVFIREIDYNGQTIWHKVLFSKNSSTPVAAVLKDSYIVSFFSFRKDKVTFEDVIQGFTYEIDKNTYKIIDKGNIFFNSIIPYKSGYIASNGKNTIYYIDNNKKIIWQKQLSKEMIFKKHVKNSYVIRHRIQKLIKTNDGNFLAIGTDDQNPWVFKFNALGKVLWQDTVEGFNQLSNNDVLQTKKNEYIIVGRGYGNQSQTWYVTALKYSNKGKLVWEKIFKTEFFSGANSVVKSENNSYIISGQANYEPWLVKIDVNGNLKWQKQYVNTNSICKKYVCSHEIEDMIKTKDGGYLLAINVGEYGTWLAKTDENLDSNSSSFYLSK
jgi:hypothetical protein